MKHVINNFSQMENQILYYITDDGLNKARRSSPSLHLLLIFVVHPRTKHDIFVMTALLKHYMYTANKQTAITAINKKSSSPMHVHDVCEKTYDTRLF